MRAVFLEDADFVAGSALRIEGEKLHHLLNVVRIKEGQRLKLLNGKGLVALAVAAKAAKKELFVDIEEVSIEKRRLSLDVAFALPKKDALEFCLRACVEIGCENVYILESERSQRYPLKEERIQKILVGGLEQSNNPFLPNVQTATLSSMPWNQYGFAALASIESGRDGKDRANQDLSGKGLLIIGPEGGFEKAEEVEILDLPNAFPVCFQGPILRAQTAIPFFAGVLSVQKGSVVDG